MKTKVLVGILSLFLVLGLGIPVMADWEPDVCGDTTPGAGVADKDIAWAKAIIFPPTEGAPGKYIKLGVDMCSGSTLPGLFMWTFDADNNRATPFYTVGGNTYRQGASAMNPGAWGDVGRPEGQDVWGLDFGITLILRDQLISPAQCSTGCPGINPAMYTYNVPHGMHLKGEWQGILVSSVGPGQADQYIFDHGRLGGYCTNADDLPAGIEGNQECFKLPWERILSNFYNHPFRPVLNPNFSWDYVSTWGNHSEFELIAMYDPVFSCPPGDGDDFFDMPGCPPTGGPTFHVTDFIPNTAIYPIAEPPYFEQELLNTQAGNNVCFDFPQDNNCDGLDLGRFVSYWLRGPADRPCPACAPYPTVDP